MSSTEPIDPTAPVSPSAPGTDPFRVFGIVGFVMSFFAFINIPGLVVSIVALVLSARAGFRNRFALAGTVISAIGVLITVVIIVFLASMLVSAAQKCAELGDGVHTVGSATYTCAPGSFYVYYGQ